MLLASKRAAELGPEHKHFKVIEARDTGNDKVKCVYCSHEMVGGATRMRAHLLKHRGVGCTPCTGDIPEAVNAEMQQAEDEAQACKLKKQKAAAVDAATRSVASSAAASSSRQSTIKEAVKRADKSSCDAALSKWAYAAGVSFPARANKLVYVHINLRLLDRTSGVSYEEQFPVWDFESEDEA